MPLLTAPEWDAFIDRHPEAHILQTSAWGRLKSAFGWQAVWVTAGPPESLTGAQVLFRHLPLGFSVAYIPRGPVGPGWEVLWPEVDALCRQHRSVLLKVEPDRWDGEEIRQGEHPVGMPGFIASRQAIQPPRTLVVCLEGDEETLLARMKQKTRYNIRLAQKKGVEVHPSQDLEGFFRLMQTTGQRDDFGVHSLAYYRRAYDLFTPQGACILLQATYAGQPLAALMAFAHGLRAWYFYGASNDLERNRMPAYLLQWEAMRWARSRGCTEYDLWGVPDEEEAVLEASFESRHDGLWGVYRFKRGFGGQLRCTVGTWDRVYIPALYAVYRWWASRREIT
jgi:lipid II:glycine glycyltransferase (peptidoglycan interpeptide bridge formation enzyme)